MRAGEKQLFGSKDGFGIEVAHTFVFDGAIFGGVCLWVGGKAIGDISQSMAFYTLATELDCLNYLERLPEDSVRRLIQLESGAADFTLDQLKELEPHQVSEFGYPKASIELP